MRFDFEGTPEELVQVWRLLSLYGLLTSASTPTAAGSIDPAAVPPPPEWSKDPVLGGPSDWKGHRGAAGPSQQTFSLPGGGTVNLPAPGSLGEGIEGLDLAAVQFDEARYADAWDAFVGGIRDWLVGWEVKGADQPDRVEIIRSLGRGRNTAPILKLAHDHGGLQCLVEEALVQLGLIPPRSEGRSAEQFDYITRLAGSLVQVGIAGFQDLTHVWDHTERWRAK